MIQQFKVGDWIRELDPLPYVKTVYQLKQSDFFGVGRKSKEYFTNIELWQPKEGEWCWFYNSNIDKWYINKWENSESQIASLWHKNCKPFIGELPN